MITRNVFVALLLSGLVNNTACLAIDQRSETAEEKVCSTFRAGDKPKLVVENFNGLIDVQAGREPTIKVEIVKSARASSKEQAEALLQTMHVSVEDEGGTVRIVAKGHSTAERRVSVRVTVPAMTTTELKTANGSVQVKGIESESVMVRSQNGSIEISRCKAAKIEVETQNGSIDLSGTILKEVVAKSGNGRVQFDGTLAAGSHAFSSRNGRVCITLPANASFGITAATDNGSIKIDHHLSTLNLKTRRHLTGKAGNQPDVYVNLTTGNGSIEVRKARE